jgi:hypothetical protein
LVILSYFCVCSCIIHQDHHLYEHDFSLFYHIGYDFALFDYVLNYMFLVYFHYVLGIVRSELYLSIGSYSACSLISWVSGKHCVGVVPIPYLPMIAPYIPDHVVDRGSDSPVESFVVHLPSIGQAEYNYYREVTAMFYIFLSNITMRRYNHFLP